MPCPCARRVVTEAKAAVKQANTGTKCPLCKSDVRQKRRTNLSGNVEIVWKCLKGHVLSDWGK